MVQEQSDQIWASFMNALNKLGSLNTYTELITILKTPLDSIKKEIGWKEKYAPIIKDLHALENFIVMMITEIKSFAATASRYYGNIKDQLKIIDDIFKDARGCMLTEDQKKSVEHVIKRIVDGLAEIDKILEKTNANLQTAQKIREVEESIVNKKIQLNEQGKVKVAEHLNNNMFLYAGGGAACGAVAAGGGATFVVMSEGILGTAGTCCLSSLAIPLTVPPLAAISIPIVLGGVLMFGLVIGVIKLTQYFVDNSVKRDQAKLEKLESDAAKLKKCTDTISEVAIRLNQSNETTKLDVENLKSCLIDYYQLKMYGNSSKINEAINDCEAIKAKLYEISQIRI